MKPLKPSMILQGTIEKLAFGGKGLLHHEGIVIFISDAIPGEKVEFQLTKVHENYAEGRRIKTLETSPFAAKTPYAPLPGANLVRLEYSEQLQQKEAQVYESLAHIASISQEAGNRFEAQPILPAPEIWGYRNKVEFSFGYSKMWYEEGEDGRRIYHDEDPVLGFHPEGRWDLIQKVEDVFLCSEKVNAVRKLAEEIMQNSEFLVWNGKISKGFWRTCIIREGKNTGELILNFVVSKEQSEKFWKPIVQKICEKIPDITGVLVTINPGRNDALSGSEKYTILFGREILKEKLEEKEYLISPFAFFQTNTKGAEKLYGTVREFATLTGTEKILDLFCGSGAIGLFLASIKTALVGLEMNASAIDDARRNAEHQKIKNAEYYCGKAEEILPNVLERHPEFDLLIVDPPRIGMHPKALQTLLTIPAKKLIYVSCNPATLARDLQILLANGWKLKKVRPVDMFPHTPHIEVVTELQR